MLLVYDHKCPLCRNLAYKIHFNAGGKIDIKALSDPDVVPILQKFYPNGWTHDFYVVHDGVCRKGLRGLPKLLRSLGLKNSAALLSEYSRYKLARAASAGNGFQQSRRNVLKFTAASPLLFGFSKFSLPDPFQSPPQNGFSVHVAQVQQREEYGGWTTTAWRCDECVLSSPRFGQGGTGTTTLANEVTLLDTTLSGGDENHNQSTLRVLRRTLESSAVRDGVSVPGVVEVYTSLLNHPRYNITLNISRGGLTGKPLETAITGMIGHDVPLPNVDYVVFENSYKLYATDYLPAFDQGLQNLKKLHFQEGSHALGQVYEEIGNGLRILKVKLEQIVPETLVPQHDKLVITSLPELMKFAELPPTVKVGELFALGCGCSCSCCCGAGGCCGCGCSLGVCIPSPICGCCCGFGVGCGCGCCCGCDLC